MSTARRSLYRVVKQQITDQLREGRWKHGQAIPSEPLLAKRFRVSVGTVRNAVDELVSEHILLREQGRGTFVASHTRDYMLNIFFQIVDRNGRKEYPQSRLLSFRRGRANKRTAYRLGINQGDPVFQIEALLSLGGGPTILDSIRVSVKQFPALTERIFAERDSTIYGLFQSRFGVTVTRVEELLTVAKVDARAAALLGLNAGDPVLQIERTSYTYRDSPVDTRIRYLRTDRYSYISQLGKRMR